MSKFKKMGIGPVLGLILLAFFLPAWSFADDTDILEYETENIQPNILIILDISGSMDYPDVQGTSETRLTVAKNAIIGMIEKKPEVRWGLMVFPWTRNPTSSYSDVVGGGRLLEPCKDRNTLETNALITTIRNLQAKNGTPVASALAEAGLYFSGQKSWFWLTDTGTVSSPTVNIRVNSSPDRSVMQYTTPIQNECQKNFIILLTDGFSSVDSGVRSYKSGSYFTYHNDVSTSKYSIPTRGDSIFFADYLRDVKNDRWIKIDGNTNANPSAGSNSNHHGYITWKTHYASDAMRDESVGLKLARFVMPFYWTAAENNLLRNSVQYVNIGSSSSTYWSVSSTSRPNVPLGGYYITWDRGLSGRPVANAAPLGTGYARAITTTDINNWQRAGEPFWYGYYPEDPSRPIPPLPVAYTSNSLTATTVVDLRHQGYIENSQIYQNNQWNSGTLASDYLDDVAALLFNEDLLPGMGDGTKYEKQNVKTYTVGFMFSSDLLERTAVMGGTGDNGEGYMQATSPQELEDAFTNIITGISQDLGMLAMPSMPASNSQETRTGDKVYFGYFQPEESGWLGNLKRFTLADNNTLGDNADENGIILDTATSDWAKTQGISGDGNDIGKGGAAQVLQEQIKNNFDGSGRNVYTYLGVRDDLTHKDNGFKSDNNANLKEVVNYTNAQNLNKLIEFVRSLPFGPIMHSSPAVIHYKNGAGAGNSVLFVGTNEGFLHAIDDADAKEKWVFIMPEHLKEIDQAGTAWPTDGRYFVDGYMATKKIDGKNLLVTGARRGGYTYVGLDVTNPDKPSFAFEVKPEGVIFDLGLSWAKPTFAYVHADIGKGVDESGDCLEKEGMTFSGRHDILILAGGYDPNYDFQDQLSVAPAAGAGIMALNLSNYQVESTFSQLNNTISPNAIKHSILTLAAADFNNDTMVDSLYFGDLGGYMFNALLYTVSTGVCDSGGVSAILTPSEDFLPYIFFNASGDKDTPSEQRKIQYAPDIVREYGNEYVYFGTGDREDPMDRDDKKVINRFFCVNNNDYTKYMDSTDASGYLTVDDLYDVTLKGSLSEKEATIDYIKDPENNKKGWYFNFTDGEVLVSAPIVYDGTVYFTTFIPNKDGMAIDPTDVCVTGSTGGTAWFYAVDYLAGGASSREIEEFKSEEVDENGNPQYNRSINIGTTIPSEVMLTVHENGDVMISAGTMLGTRAGLTQFHVGNATQPGVFYWRQIY